MARVILEVAGLPRDRGTRCPRQLGPGKIRRPDTRLVSQRLSGLGIAPMRPWREALVEYLGRNFFDFLRWALYKIRRAYLGSTAKDGWDGQTTARGSHGHPELSGYLGIRQVQNIRLDPRPAKYRPRASVIIPVFEIRDRRVASARASSPVAGTPGRLFNAE